MSADGALGDAPAARVGRQLGKYVLEAVIGSGGMADVYVARHPNGHRVAIKVLKPALAVSAEVQRRFRREGYAANRVEHPGAVRVLDDDITPDGLAFLVLELLEGSTFAELARAHGGMLPPELAAKLGCQVLEILSAAHAAGVIHRDVKPENLLLLPNGEVKVLDFGVASVREPLRASATVSGRMLGTPAFMPPEQAYGRRSEIDEQSDVWALGATLFALVTGRVVHVAPTAEETLVRAATERAPSVRSVARGVPEPIAGVIDRALAREKAARWPSASAMAAALSHASAARGPGRRWSTITPVAVGIGVLCGVAALESIAPGADSPSRAGDRRRVPAVVVAELANGRTTLARQMPREDSSGATPTVASPNGVAAPRGRSGRDAGVEGATVSPPPPTEIAVTHGVCGFEIDDEGHKWPRRCPPGTASR